MKLLVRCPHCKSLTILNDFKINDVKIHAIHKLKKNCIINDKNLKELVNKKLIIGCGKKIKIVKNHEFIDVVKN